MKPDIRESINATSSPRRGDQAGLLGSSFTFLRVRGIPIGAHWSWLFVFALVAWSLGAVLFPREFPELSSETYLVMGAAAALLFFLSIVLHELGHALRAITEGMKIREITLWLFGGVARFEGMFPSAGAEFRIAIAGPIVSVVLSIVFFAAAWATRTAEISDSIVGVLSYLGRINAIVVAFNMVPALPLDGGRVLRSWLWHRQRSFAAATFSAARAGKAFAYMLITIGILSFFTQAVTGGVWFVFLGWFLLQAAQSEVTFVYVRQAFRGVRVKDLMTGDPAVVGPDTTIQELLDHHARLHGHSTYPVASNGRYVGMISLRVAGAVEADQRWNTRVEDVMVPATQTQQLHEDESVLDILEVVRSGNGRAAVVDQNGAVTGILSMSDVARALELEQIRGVTPEPAQRRAGIVVWIVVAVLLIAAGSAFYHPPVALISPGDAVDISRDVTIDGVDTTPINGRMILLAVQLSRPNGLQTIAAMFRTDQEIIPIGQVTPPGVSEEEFIRQQRTLFSESQRLAAAAAAQQAGLQVNLSGTGAVVAGVVPGSPASDQLKGGDVIVQIDGTPVRLANDLRQITTREAPGTTFQLRVERDGSPIDLSVQSARLQSADGPVTGLGILVTTRDFKADLPFEVSFRSRTIGGPSAGLAYALVISDLLTSDDIIKGRTIAATGTITAQGEVGPVGGISQKAIAASRANSTILLVPGAEVDQAGGSQMRIRGVDTLEQAVNALRA